MLTHTPWVGVRGLRHGFLDGRDCDHAPSWDAAVASAGVPLPVLVPRQVHGTRVVAAERGGERPEADGLVVVDPGLLVGIVTADCVPVLLVEPRRRVAAAVHAGWRGAAAGVLEEALAQLATLHATAPSDLEAVIGPAAGGCCYEVGPEVREAFRARTADVTATAWTPGEPRDRVDLRLAAALLLRAAGVSRVDVIGPCTVCGTGYHSYRRDGQRAGRQLSFIGWATP